MFYIRHVVVRTTLEYLCGLTYELSGKACQRQSILPLVLLPLHMVHRLILRVDVHCYILRNVCRHPFECDLRQTADALCDTRGCHDSL
jgi:hypothetical protein